MNERLCVDYRDLPEIQVNMVMGMAIVIKRFTLYEHVIDVNKSKEYNKSKKCFSEVEKPKCF